MRNISIQKSVFPLFFEKIVTFFFIKNYTLSEKKYASTIKINIILKKKRLNKTKKNHILCTLTINK
jgi:hypothetical protein